jgi:RimJ/RimL family protein N-acetyltransferase
MFWTMRPEEPPLGAELTWSPIDSPRPIVLRGSHIFLRPVDPHTDAGALYAQSHPPDGDPAIWTYLPTGPYPGADEWRVMLERASKSLDPLYFTLVRSRPERPAGMASYLRAEPAFGVIEIGNIWFGPSLQRTTAATEAIYLLARHAFDDLGYRRLEWKCNSLNAASRRAALRFGFTFEGIFRQHMVVKGRNRDTAWYAITDQEWPAVRSGFEAWLSPGNFDAEGHQERPLSLLIAQAREMASPGPL